MLRNAAISAGSNRQQSVPRWRRGRKPGDDPRRMPRANGVRMEIQTSRFGTLVVEDDRVMTFPNGLLGFPNCSRFALIQTGSENYFFWLQSVEDPSLAFVITDPNIFFKDYEVPVREESQQE